MPPFPRALILSLGSLFLFACKQEKTIDKNTDKALTPTREKNSTLNPTSDLSNTSTAPSKTFSLLKLQKTLENLSPESLSNYSDSIRDLINNNPDQAAQILEVYCNLLAENNPAQAIDFSYDLSSFLPQSETGKELASSFLKNWKKEDPTALNNYLKQLSNFKESNEYRSREIIGLLMKPDSDSDFQSQQWLTWIDSLNSGESKTTELQGAALDIILKHSTLEDTESFLKISAAYKARISDPAMQKYLDEYTSFIAHNYPKQTREVLNQIPAGSYREQILERVMSDLGREHPEIAAEWLSSPEILKDIFRPLSDDIKADAKAHNATDEQVAQALAAYESEANIIFDRSLQAYIFNLVHQHPEDAMQTVEAMTDPKRRESLRGRIQAIIDTFEKEGE